MIRRALLILVLLNFLSPKLAFSQVPTPAKEHKGYLMIKGGTIHVGNGEVINDGLILINNGKIEKVGTQSDSNLIDSVALITSPIEVVLVEGEIYPGLIAVNTQLGLKEIDRVRASRDYREVGINNANVRSIIAYNAESKILPTVKYNGILLAEIAPQGSMIAGQSSIVELDAWNWQDAAYKVDMGLHIYWPSYRYNEKLKARREKQVAELDKIFREARAYSKQASPEVKNLKLEAMRGLFDGTKKVFVHADRAVDMVEAVQFMNRYGIKTVIVGATQVAQIIPFMKEHEVSIVLIRTHHLPSTTDAAYDEVYSTPKALQDSGVLFCIADEESWQQRNLPFQAGTAAAFGLSKEQALAAISSNTAQIYGLDSLGTIEEGKDATLVVSTGDILDMRTNKISLALIRGKILDLNNHQEQLYKKYKAKYEEN